MYFRTDLRLVIVSPAFLESRPLILSVYLICSIFLHALLGQRACDECITVGPTGAGILDDPLSTAFAFKMAEICLKLIDSS